MKTSMKEMARQKAARKAGTPEGKRNPKIISPYQQRAKAKSWNDDKHAEPELVVRDGDLERLRTMGEFATNDARARVLGMKPRKPPPVAIPERNDAARVAARKDR